MTYTIEQAYKKIKEEWKPSAPTIVYDRMGNKFTVCYIVPLEDGTHDYTSKRFDTLEDALSVYQTFIEYFTKGLYSVTDRKNLLK